MIEVALMCVSLVVYYESRSDPFEDQVRVAQTVLNRAALIPRYQGDVCQVAFDHKQFSDMLMPLKTPTEEGAWDVAIKAASNAYRLTEKGIDLTHGALYFHNWHELGDKPRYHRKLKYKGKSHVWY